MEEMGVEQVGVWLREELRMPHYATLAVENEVRRSMVSTIAIRCRVLQYTIGKHCRPVLASYS